MSRRTAREEQTSVGGRGRDGTEAEGTERVSAGPSREPQEHEELEGKTR